MGSNKFIDGFIWGLLLGGGAVFLLGTKKGNKLLKIITEEGSGTLNEIIKEVEEVSEDMGFTEEPKNTQGSLKHSEKEEESHENTKVRRFFKASKKS